MMKSESGDIDQDWTHEGFKHSYNPATWMRPFKYPVPDSVRSWHDVVEDYSKLHLTFSKDRLPALAAIVQRMLRMRKTDEYIVGLWKSSLPSDVAWQSRDREKKPRPALLVPSWSWASVIGTVDYGFAKKLAWIRSIDISYGSEALSKRGHAGVTTILLECHSCNGVIRRFTSSRRSIYGFDPIEESLVVPPLERAWRVEADYDYSTGSKPVQHGDAVVIAVIESSRLDMFKWSGLVLRQISQTTYERIGWSDVSYDTEYYFVSRKAKLRDNFAWRYHRSFVASLPVRSFRIV